MTVTVHPIPLSERIKTAKRGRVSQSEYCPCVIQQWGNTPIKAFFGRSTKWKTLFGHLGLELTQNPTYQEVAAMIDPNDEEFTTELLLLASPIWDAKKGDTKT
ncbi:hypothetical protein ACTQ4E_15915 [Lawsonibacter sp. LCP25S3_G6]|uniref:hypothetical protein n=1 Tax=unclassified Lawsonibacter TaxID=2617946 RepID=UPI003F987030